MPEGRKPNQFARLVAVFALVAAVFVVVLTIATWGGAEDGDNGGDDGDTTEQAGPTKKGERALERGVWVVGEGDTLVSIAEDTGLDVDELVELNPSIDPQVLSPGQRIALREGGVNSDEDDGDSGGTTTEDAITEGSGIGDDSSSGTSTTDTDDSFSN